MPMLRWSLSLRTDHPLHLHTEPASTWRVIVSTLKNIATEMADFLTHAQRSRLMSRVRGKNTEIERAVFRELRRRKIYFSRHGSGIPGRPDIVFRRCKLAVFIDGDFWHGRNFAEWRHKLTDPWKAKIARNIERDREIDQALRRSGWRVLHLWGSEIKHAPEDCVNRIITLRTFRYEERLSA
jgi:DNA mismatch endonuclease, patch repair protein